MILSDYFMTFYNHYVCSKYNVSSASPGQNLKRVRLLIRLTGLSLLYWTRTMLIAHSHRDSVNRAKLTLRALGSIDDARSYRLLLLCISQVLYVANDSCSCYHCPSPNLFDSLCV